ncbi:MAG TPA: Flp family type IVb pilin [Proteiniclasticum sp.]|uniref:Flp family type IVb pilin n=1 Tax=Proteiniclasticum sp. TaxID=2053595 RepID=UPI000E9B718A|nr:Flp family type IVb pilin [Proteiniclasticum sp.]HBW14339.1 Flp family type IVb pilin [Proteiniclasticum sp.]
MMDLLKRIWKEEEGQGLVEYGLILLLMVVIAVAVVSLFRPQINALFQRIGNEINDAPGAVESGT